jgi:hypothetical protein
MTRPAASDDKNREEHMQRNSTLPRTSDTERVQDQKQWSSLSRISSEVDRFKDGGSGDAGLSQRGSMADISEFEDFPCKGVMELTQNTATTKLLRSLSRTQR